MTRMQAGPTIILVISFATAAVVTSCSLTSHFGNSAFDAVQIGDAKTTVISRFGRAESVRERPGEIFTRYANRGCEGQCVERLWFENRLSFDIEAWSVELDKNNRVINKYHWLSP